LPSSARVFELFRHRPADADHGGSANVFPIAVRPIPTEWEMTHSLAAQAFVKRRTSRTFRFDNLSAGIGLPLRIAKKGRAQLRLPTTLPASPFQQGGRLRSESVAAFDRIGWPHCLDFRIGPPCGSTRGFASRRRT
jgi:hypothetical protein